MEVETSQGRDMGCSVGWAGCWGTGQEDAGALQGIAGCGSQLRVQGGLKGPVRGAARVIIGLAPGVRGCGAELGHHNWGDSRGHIVWGAQQGTMRG